VEERGARNDGFPTIHDLELMVERERAGSEASRSAAASDRRSVKAPSRNKGHEVGEKIVGHFHIAVEGGCAAECWSLHDDEAGALDMVDKALGYDPRHDLILLKPSRMVWPADVAREHADLVQ
jgi:hypothetical protein